MAVSLAQSRRVFTINGDTATDLELTTTPSVGNVLIALVYAEGDSIGYPGPTTTASEGWSSIQDSYASDIWVGAYSMALFAPQMVESAPFSFTATGADRLVVHLYEVEAPDDGFAYAFIGGAGAVSWHDEVQSNGETAQITFSGFPLITSDIEMGMFVIGGFSTPLANTTTQPTISRDFGGNIGPATDGGRFATDFASVEVTAGQEEWNLAWTGAQSDSAVFMALGLMVDDTGFTRVQQKASLTSSLVLTTTPAVGNLLVATVATGDDEVPADKAGWNRIVGPANDDGDRVCIFWREVATGQGTTISFDIDSGYGMSVEEWSGFLGSPEVAGVALGGSGSAFDSGGDEAVFVTLIPPLPIIDRIAMTGLLLSGHPSGVASMGDGFRTGIAGQRVYSGADASRIVSSYYPGLLGTYWTSDTPLEAVGLVAVFSDSSVVSDESVDPEEPEEPTGPFVFPDEGSRLAYTAPSRRGGALTSAKGVQGYVYLDAGGTTLATITDLDGDVIAGSLITVGADSKIPLFMGPGTVTTLYIKWAGTTAVHPVYARSQSAPVPAGGTGSFFTDVPVFTLQEVFEGGEFTIIGTYGASPDIPLFHVIAARMIVPSGPNAGDEVGLVGTAVAEVVDGEPTGRYVISAAQTGQLGGQPSWASILVPNLQILNLFAGTGSQLAVGVGDPILTGDPETDANNANFAASQGWVDDKFWADLPVIDPQDADAEMTVIGRFGENGEYGAADGKNLIEFVAAKVGFGEQTLYLSGFTIPEIGLDGQPTGRYVLNAGSTGLLGGQQQQWSTNLIETRKISDLLTGTGITNLCTVIGDPIVGEGGEEANASYAASQGWVIGKLATAGGGGGAYIDATTFGVEADTGTDQYSAIMDAVEAAREPKKNVLLPPGIITTHRKVMLPSGMGLSGSGMEATILTKPPTVSSPLVGDVPSGSTSLVVEDASGFSVGDSLHIYTGEHHEWDSTQAVITAVDTDSDTIEFTPPAWADYTGEGFASTSFGLIGNYVPVNPGEEFPGTVGGFLTDLTLDHNGNEFDPSGNMLDGEDTRSFPISTMHLEMAKHFRTERVKFINAPGDAYSDQGRDFYIGTNSNVVRECVFESPSRHAIHLGTGNSGARIENNTITGIRDGHALFYCADVTFSVASGNRVNDNTYGMAGIDGRDKWNTIVNNTFHNCCVPLLSGNPGASDDEDFGLCFEGNTVFIDADRPPLAPEVYVNLPGLVFSGNRLHNCGVRVGDQAHRSIVTGNHFSADPDGPDANGAVGIEGTDCIVSNNEIHNFTVGINIQGGHRLVVENNIIIPNAIVPPEFVYEIAFAFFPADGVQITGKHAIGYLSDIGLDLIGDSPRLIFNGMASNGANDPNSPSSWYLPGERYNGTLVRWGSGDIEKVSVYVHGSGWILLGNV